MSKDTPFKLSSGVYLTLIKHHKILLVKRQNTRWASGLYSFISGFIDGNESIVDAAKREAKEEAGIEIRKTDLKIFHIIHRKSGDAEFIDFFLLAKGWHGKPTNLEPNKCGEMKWFSLNNLPENIVPHVKTVLDYYRKGEYFFSENGF